MSDKNAEGSDSIEEIQKKIKSLISDNKTEAAIKLLSKNPYSNLDNNLINLSSRLNKLQELELTGTIAADDALLEMNKINMAIVKLSDNLGKPSESDNAKAKKSSKFLVFLIPVLIVLGAIAIKYLPEAKTLEHNILDGQTYTIFLKGTVRDLKFYAKHWVADESNNPQHIHEAIFLGKPEEGKGYGINNRFRFDKLDGNKWAIIGEDMVFNSPDEKIFYCSDFDQEVRSTSYDQNKTDYGDGYKFIIEMNADSSYRIKNLLRKEYLHVDLSTKKIMIAGNDVTENKDFIFKVPPKEN